jgi:oligosaccharide repeat unit polymerase
MNRMYRARPLSELPFYCHPVYLFLAAWVVMLGTLEVQVSESTYPDRWLGVALFIVSVAAMLFGFLLARRFDDSGTGPGPSLKYAMDTERIRRFTSLLGVSVLAIAAFNWAFSGPPPVFAFFGISTTNYLEYGRFKQVLFPMTMAVFVNSLLDPSRMRRWVWAIFSLGILVAYVSRGNLILALAQALILYSIRTPVSKRRIYVRALVVVFIGIVAVDLIGNNRTSQDIFLEFMEIKASFRSWPMAVLWPVTYFSVPISNLCWIVHNAHFTQPAISFLYPVLPAFWAPPSPHDIPLSDSHIIDGVHTYLANYFLDFSWIGVVACNLGVGLLSGFLVNKQRISRMFLLSPIVLSAIAFIFFWDFFVYLPSIIELGIQALIQRLCIVPVDSPRADGAGNTHSVAPPGPPIPMTARKMIPSR